MNRFGTEISAVRRSLSPHELAFHLSVLHAAGGIVMSSDDLPRLSTPQLARLEKLAQPPSADAEFDAAFDRGRAKQNGRDVVYLLNWSDAPSRRAVPAGVARELWTGETPPGHELEMAPRSGTVWLTGG